MTNIRVVLRFAFVLILPLTLTGCGQGKGPADTVESFFGAIIAGDITVAEEYLSQGAIEELGGPEWVSRELEAMAQDFEENGFEVTITSEEIQGETAQVRVEAVVNTQEELGEQVIELVIEEGEWKLTL